MIKKEFKEERICNVVGGVGGVVFRYLADATILDQKKIRAFNLLTIEPESSIGYHIHEGESEISYILNGKAVIRLDGTDYHAKQGNLAFCPSGHSHSVRNEERENLQILALVVLD